MKPARGGGRKSNVTYASCKRGVVVLSDRSMLAVLGDAICMLDTAGREGMLTSNEQDVRETPSRTYLRKLRFATRGWINSTAIQR